MERATATLPTRTSDYAGGIVSGTRVVVVEAPVAIEISGVAYAVMMATPVDLEDFVTGFVLSEGLATVNEIGTPALTPVADGEGWVARVNLPPHRLAPIMERARRRLGDSSCGICGIESIEAALRPLPPIAPAAQIDPAAIRIALANLRRGQRLGGLTAATHAAAFADPTGAVIALREDVGRHNALDKVIGALARAGIDPAGGFLLVTSRCSYELVEKAVRARCPLLVAISAPSDLAVRRAAAAGLALAVVARDDTMQWVSGQQLESNHGL